MSQRLLCLMGTALILAGGVAACGGDSGSGRPASTAKIAILQPTPNQVTGPTPTVQLQLTGGTIVPFTSTKLVPNQGHIHLFVDDKLVSMTLGLTQVLPTPLPAGLHTLRAEFVATDHLPWANRVTTAILFTVQ